MNVHFFFQNLNIYVFTGRSVFWSSFSLVPSFGVNWFNDQSNSDNFGSLFIFNFNFWVLTLDTVDFRLSLWLVTFYYFWVWVISIYYYSMQTLVSTIESFMMYESYYFIIYWILFLIMFLKFPTSPHPPLNFHKICGCSHMFPLCFFSFPVPPILETWWNIGVYPWRFEIRVL